MTNSASRRSFKPVSLIGRSLVVAYEIERSKSRSMSDALTILERVAPSNLTVIFSGEPGTGKEWAAHTIHRLSTHAGGPFQAVDCSAFPPEQLEKEIFGYEAISWQGVDVKQSAFEEATGGTLFFHDFDTIPDPLQLKVARAVEYEQFRRMGGEQMIRVACRIIVSLQDRSSASRSQIPFYDAFASHATAIRIEIPPLRNRREDIPVLIQRMLVELEERYGQRVAGMSPEAIDLCRMYDWPGNVRQLKNAVEYASIMSQGETILPRHLPDTIHMGIAGEPNGKNRTGRK